MASAAPAPSAAATATGFIPYSPSASSQGPAAPISQTPPAPNTGGAPANLPAGFIPYVPGQTAQQPVTPPAAPTAPAFTPTPSEPFSANTDASRLKSIPSTLFDAMKSFMTGNAGEEIASGIGAGQAAQNEQNISDTQSKNLDMAIKARNALKAQGKDTSSADAMIQSEITNSPAKAANPLAVNPAGNDTNLQGLGNAAAIAGNVLGFGTYGAAKTAAMQTGELAAKGGVPAIVGGAETAVNAAKTAANATANVAKTVAPKAVLNSGARETLGQLANPEAKAFVPVAKGGLGQTFSDVVSATQKGIDSFVSTSKAALQAVKQQIPTDIKVEPSKIATAVNDGILKSVQSNAAYHGINGDVASMFKTPDDLISSGLLDPNEAAKVKGMVDVIKGWSDNSARGVLNLKEQLASFYKPGMDNSNAILRNIQSNLKDVVGEVYPQIKPALATASANIDKADEFTRGLTGTNPTTGESKLISIAKNLDNPALRGYQHSLLADLKGATGVDIMPKLQGYADYTKLLAKGFPSKLGTLAKGIATSPVAEITGAAALAGAGIGELKNL